MDLIEAKRALRARMLAAREACARAGEAAAEAVRERFLATFADRLAAAPRPAVSAYWPIGAELDVRPLLDALDRLGCALGLPVVGARREALAFRRWRPGDPLVAARFGLSEPAAAAPLVVPEIMIVPLLAFDEAGRRLGYGGGYFDRTIRALRARGPLIAAGVGYDAQAVPRVPAGERDAPLDWVVTERRAIRCAATAEG